jgi:diguanylate cyclase (GGDEF)-like protein/PAS domain S-box-containing protein
MGPSIDKNKSTEHAMVRHSEDVLQTKASVEDDTQTSGEMRRILHELQVHQIELEMQNAELKQARNELEAALEKFTDLYDFAPVGYMTLNRDGIISDLNLRGAGLLGIERTKLRGRRFGQFVKGEYLPAFIDSIFASQSKEAFELTLLNEEKLPVIVQIEAKLDESGQNCHLALIDITARRQAEDALRENEQHMYRLAEMAVKAIIMMDDSGMVTYCNAEAEKMFGCSHAEITGRNFQNLFIPQQNHTTAEQGVARFKELGTGPLIGKTTEVTALRKDGTEFPLELSISALKLQGKWHAIGIMTDVTERKQLETEIQDAREYAENIVETVRRPLVVLNADLKIRTANYSFYHTFKVTPADTIGRSIYDLGNRQWDIPSLRGLFGGILLNDTKIKTCEVEHDFPGIGRRIILLNARQIFQKKTNSHIILLAMEDITARKVLEAEIQDAREYAENIVETVREPLVVLNANLKVLTANHSFYDTFMVSPEDTIGNFIYDLGDRQWDIPKLRVLIEEILPHDTVFNGYEVEHDFPGIGRKTIMLNARQIFRENIGSHIILLAMEDITARKEIEATLRHCGTHDILTGLYNRAFFEEELERLAQSRMFPMSIVMADVNDLKPVNDTQGHAAGDHLIRLAASIILEAFRAEDIIARIGGDEFAVLLPATDTAVAEEAVERIMSCPEIVTGQVSIAFGIATAKSKDQLAEALKLSDERMYRNKSAQKDS